MNQCLNCQNELLTKDNFCSACGARIIRQRLSIKEMWANFSEQFLGLDNKLFRTIKAMFAYPEDVIQGYVDGRRKKYMAPITFLALGTAIATILYNLFSENFVAITDSMTSVQFDLIESQLNSEEAREAFRNQRAEQADKTRLVALNVIKYINIFIFINVPIYALIAKIVFRKPYNYAEHLLSICYIQGLLSFVSLILFLLSLVLSPGLYSLTILIQVVYYIYVYARLYDLSGKQIFFRILRFILVGIMFMLSSFFIGIILAFARRALE